MDSVTPLAAYQSALNYSSEDDNNMSNSDDASTTIKDANIRNNNNNQMASFKRIVSRLNNSIYIYPTISVFLLTISTIFIVFTKAINTLYKVFAVILLFIYIAITVYWFKK